MECVICLEHLSPHKDHHPEMSCCKKRVHKSCFQKWNDRNLIKPRCPCCNSSLSPTKLRNIQEEINRYLDDFFYKLFSTNPFSCLMEEEIEYKYINPSQFETENEIIFRFDFGKRLLSLCFLKPIKSTIQLDLIDITSQTSGLFEENEPCIIIIDG